MKIRPARGYVLIQPLEADEVSAGGVYMPERAKDLPTKGKVLAFGLPPLEMIKVLGDSFNVGFKQGDTIIFKRVELPTVKDFEKLARFGRAFARKKGIKEKDLLEDD